MPFARPLGLFGIRRSCRVELQNWRTHRIRKVAKDSRSLPPVASDITARAKRATDAAGDSGAIAYVLFVLFSLAPDLQTADRTHQLKRVMCRAATSACLVASSVEVIDVQCCIFSLYCCTLFDVVRKYVRYDRLTHIAVTIIGAHKHKQRLWLASVSLLCCPQDLRKDAGETLLNQVKSPDLSIPRTAAFGILCSLCHLYFEYVIQLRETPLPARLAGGTPTVSRIPSL